MSIQPNDSGRRNSRKWAVWSLLLVVVLAAACTSTAAPTAAPSVSTPALLPATAAAPTAVPSALTAAAIATVADTVAPAATMPAAPQLSSDEVIKAVQAAWAAAAKAGARQVKQTSAKGSATVSTAEAEFVAPDTYHMVLKFSGQVMGEQYWYGGTMYTMSNAQNSPNPGKWGKLPTGSVKQFEGVLGGFADALASGIVYADGKVEGIVPVNGGTAILYSYTTQLKGLPNKYVTKVWVDTATGLPVRQEKNQSGGLTTVQDITYDATVNITVPPDVLAAPVIKE